MPEYQVGVSGKLNYDDIPVVDDPCTKITQGLVEWALVTCFFGSVPFMAIVMVFI